MNVEELSQGTVGSLEEFVTGAEHADQTTLNVPRRRCSSGKKRNHTAGRRHTIYPGSGPSGEVKPLRPAMSCIALLGEVTVQSELGELEVATMAEG